MKHIPVIFLLLVLAMFAACNPDTKDQDTNNQSKDEETTYSDISDLNPTDTLFRVQMTEESGLDAPCAYVSQKGDTVIPLGKYTYCFLDTVTTFAIVADAGKTAKDIYAIDPQQNRLYEIYWYDNGPDYLSDGLFRIKRNGKIGYAKPNGEVAIKAQFECADPFEEGRARVSLNCELAQVGEHTEMKSDEWFFIDKSGEKIQ